jgi:TRAP-type uncharacterized transport system substrate-binding protein
VLLLLTLSACSPETGTLRLARPVSALDASIAEDVARLFNAESRIDIELTDDAHSGEEALSAVLDGHVDIAMVSNAQPYREGITTIIPMFPTVLHIAYVGDRDTTDISTLLDGATVFAGAPGSASRMLFQQGIDRAGRDIRNFEYVAEVDSGTDVVVVFAPIAPDQLRKFPGVRLFSLGAPDSIGTGSAIDSATLLNPYLKPFVIPVDTYLNATPEPVLTLAVDKVLVARRDLDPNLVYYFISELLRLKPALAAGRPAVFRDLTGDFDPGNSTFVLHAGAQAYIERDEPTVYERYSGVAEVLVTVLIALISATLGGMRIYRMRRKNRIDAFYSQVIDVRKQAEGGASDEEKLALIQKLKGLQDNAFEQLVEEKLAADESFRIFITLSNDVLRQLGAHDGDMRVSDS